MSRPVGGTTTGGSGTRGAGDFTGLDLPDGDAKPTVRALHRRSGADRRALGSRDDPVFSILIPTWNNLDYLKLCVASIRKNSVFDHEIVVHVNDGSDGTLDWVRQEGIAHTFARENLGVPLSVNLLAAKATREWILFLNDDMWVCPGWDRALVDEISAAGTEAIFLCSRLIEPVDTGDRRFVFLDCGRGPADFDEAKLLANQNIGDRHDERFVFSQPTLVKRTLWALVGGYSIEFSPGMSSDDDLIMKLWAVGCREYRLVDRSRVYHFACRSTGRIRKNRGGRTFLMKWGVAWKAFAGRHVASGDTGLPKPTRRERWKRAWLALQSDYPIEDITAWNGMPLPPAALDALMRDGEAGVPADPAN